MQESHEHIDHDLETTPGKRGPKPKELTEGVIVGLPVGRNKKIVPPEQVYELAALGCKTTEIAHFFGVTEDAISRNFADQLTQGREEMKISLRRAMLSNAIGSKNVTMQIWLSKQYLGFRDTPVDTEGNQPLPWSDSDDV